MMNELLYFAYGSNMFSKWLRQSDRVPSASFVTTAYLSGYIMSFNKRSTDGSGKGNIIKSGYHDHVIHGVVFSIDASDKPQLDKVEGLGEGYSEANIQMTYPANVGLVFAYIADTDYIDDTLLPYGWYKDLVLAGAKEHSLPADYIAELAKIQSIVDMDTKRRNKAYQFLG